MRGLGRIVALAFVLAALALQGFAPAQALAMPKDAFGFPICSAAGLGSAPRHAPDHGHEHDCCTAACALVGLAGFPPSTLQIAPPRVAATPQMARAPRTDAPKRPPPWPPNARGPPLRTEA